MEKFKVSFEANNQQLKALGTKHASDTYADIEATFVLGNRWTDMDSVSAVWWNDFTKIATVLDSQGKCIVPHEVLTRKGCVRVNLVGSIVEGDELVTRLTSYSAEAVQVNEKIKLTGTETSEITPSQFEQFVAIVQDAVANIKDIVSTTLNADYTLTFVYSDGTSYTTPSIRGERGPQGADGADGTDGNGIASAVLNSNYTLTLMFTDGTSYTTPSIRGAQGPKGDPGDVSQEQLDAAVTDLKSDFKHIVGRTNLLYQATWTTGAYISESGVISPYGAAKYTSLIPISANKVVYYYKASTTSTTTRIHGYDSNGNWIKQITSFPTGTVITNKEFVFYPKDCAYIRISESTTITPMALVDGGSVVDELSTDEVRFKAVKDGVTFTNAVWSNLYLYGGEIVTINMGALSSKVNVYISTDTDHPLLINSAGTYSFTATADGWLSFYDFGVAGFSMSATILLHSRYDTDISEIRTAIAPPQEYVVDINGNGDYTSFSACLKALANNSNLKRITVLEGIYDIYSEIGGSAYVDSLTGTDWRSVNDIVPPNTIIQGVGDVYLNYLPETAAEVGKTLISPLNLSGSVEVHNINIHCKNCRYAIHLEGSALSAFDNTEIVLDNVNIVREQGLYARQVLGSGLNKGCALIVKNCTWENTESQNFYVHTNSLIKHPRITVENCQFITHGTSSFYFSSENKVHDGEVLVRLNGVYANNENIVKADIQNGDCFHIVANGCNALTQSTFNTGYPMNSLDQYLTIS